MPLRRRASSSDSGSDNESLRSYGSRSSGGSNRSRETNVSRAAIRGEHVAIKFMKYVTGAPKGPVALKKVTVREAYQYDQKQYLNGHYDFVPMTSYNEYERLYWEPVHFDDSISEIVGKRNRPSSRMSSSSRSSKSSKSKSKHRRAPQFEQPPQFEPRDQYGDSSGSEDDYYDDGQFDDQSYYGPPPGQYPPPPMHMGPPPPPPPPPVGGGASPGFIDLSAGGSGGGGKFRDGWD